MLTKSLGDRRQKGRCHRGRSAYPSSTGRRRGGGEDLGDGSKMGRSRASIGNLAKRGLVTLGSHGVEVDRQGYGECEGEAGDSGWAITV